MSELYEADHRGYNPILTSEPGPLGFVEHSRSGKLPGIGHILGQQDFHRLEGNATEGLSSFGPAYKDNFAVSFAVYSHDRQLHPTPWAASGYSYPPYIGGHSTWNSTDLAGGQRSPTLDEEPMSAACSLATISPGLSPRSELDRSHDGFFPTFFNSNGMNHWTSLKEEIPTLHDQMGAVVYPYSPALSHDDLGHSSSNESIDPRLTHASQPEDESIYNPARSFFADQVDGRCFEDDEVCYSPPGSGCDEEYANAESVVQGEHLKAANKYPSPPVKDDAGTAWSCSSSSSSPKRSKKGKGRSRRPRKAGDHVCHQHPNAQFRNASELRKHMQTKHTRPFLCTFWFADCREQFGSRNEWKRHVHSQHLRLDYWQCDKCDSSKVFNRKDLFGQHVRRMHLAPLERSKKNKKFLDPKAQTEEIERFTERCHKKQREAPPQSTCGFCGMRFQGRGSWDQRMEHVGRHYETQDVDTNPEAWKADNELIQWGIREGLVGPGNNKKRRSSASEYEDVEEPESKRARNTSNGTRRFTLLYSGDAPSRPTLARKQTKDEEESCAESDLDADGEVEVDEVEVVGGY